VIYINVYAINQDTYNYYNLLNQQISAGNQLFDPITQELQGNVFCASDSGKLVFGKFEASAYIKQTFLLSIDYVNDGYVGKFKNIPNLPYIPPYPGTPTLFPPSFFVN
jgi:hypothetical protein